MSRLEHGRRGHQNQPFLAGGGGVPSMTRMMGCWYSRSYCLVRGLKMSHCTGFGMPTCVIAFPVGAHGRGCYAEAQAHQSSWRNAQVRNCTCVQQLQ